MLVTKERALALREELRFLTSRMTELKTLMPLPFVYLDQGTECIITNPNELDYIAASLKRDIEAFLSQSNHGEHPMPRRFDSFMMLGEKWEP